MCIYCHRILHNAEVQGLCVLPKPVEEKIIQDKDDSEEDIEFTEEEELDG